MLAAAAERSEPLAATATRTWLPAIFAPTIPNERERALAHLEVAGLSLKGDAFVRSVETGHRPLIELFRKAGIDLNATGPDGRTALLTAALRRDWRLFDELLRAGVNVNLADNEGVTPLMVVAASDHLASLRALLQQGAAAEAVDKRGHRAVHYAVAGKALGSLGTLLEGGASCAGECCPGHDLLAHAFEAGDGRLVEPVLTRLPASLEWNTLSRAALVSAIESRQKEQVRLLLSKHPAAPTPEGRAQPMLAYALLSNNLEYFRFLLECGADPNTPLNSPVEKDFSENMPRTFLRHYLEEEPGMTTLMLAAGMGKYDFAKALLEKGAKRGIGTAKHKLPATVFAARTEHTDLMQLLIGDCPSPEECRIEISLGSQRATVYRYGSAVMSTSVSTGRRGFATPPGRYVVTDKHRDHRSTIYKVPMPYFMRLNYRDFGMHQGVVPGHPASHGCIRVPAGTASRLFKDIPVGTLVTIN